MATPSWHNITRSEDFQALPPEARSALKQEFFQRNLLPVVEKDDTLKSIGTDRVRQWFMAQPDDSGQGYASSMLGSAGRGFGEIVPGAIEGVGALTGIDALREGGQSIREGLEDIAPVNPVYADSFPVKAAGVGGQVGSTILTAGAGGAIGKALGGVGAVSRGAQTAALGTGFLQGAGEGAREAEKYGMTGPAAYGRTLLGGVTEAGTELLPFGALTETRAAQRLLGAAPRAGNFATDVLTEGAEEATGQAASNLATTALAPTGVETPGVTEGVLEAGALGAVGGSLFGGINALTTPNDDFAKRAALEGATEFTPAVVPEAITTPNGITINKGAPAVITPEFLEGLSEQDLAEAEQSGFITRPPIVTVPVDATPEEQAVIEEADANLKAATDVAPATVEAMREVEAITSEVIDTPVEEAPPATATPSWIQDTQQASFASLSDAQKMRIQQMAAEYKTAREIAKDIGVDADVVIAARSAMGIPPWTTERNLAGGGGVEDPAFTKWRENFLRSTSQPVSSVATKPLTQEAADQEALGEGSQLQSAEEGSIPSVTADIIDDEAQESSPEIEPAQPDETVSQQPEIGGQPAIASPTEQTSPDAPVATGEEVAAVAPIEQSRKKLSPANSERFDSRKEAESRIAELLETVRASEKAIQIVEESGVPLDKLYTPVKQGGKWAVARTREHEVAAAIRNASQMPKVSPATPIDQRREELIQQAEVMPLQTRGFAEGDPVAVKVAGKEVIGTLNKVNPDDTADVDYSWNGEDYANVQSMLRKIRRPSHSLAQSPGYAYTQEQNSRKAQRFGMPAEAGITIDAGPLISTVLKNIAKDTATSPMLRAAARALGNTRFDKVDLRIENDGRRKYAGYYLSDEGISEIGVNLRQVARGNVDAIGTLVHEALHHATLAKVRDPQPGIEQESVEALNQIIKRIRAYAGLQEKGKKFDYETSNVEEFISALFTRPDFQDFLAAIPDTFSPKTGAAKFRSILSEIFRIIAQIVTGQKVQKGSTMEQAMASTLVLFDTPQRTISTTVESAADSDAEYLAAVEKGDMETAQRIVDEEAKKAGYNVGPVYRGSNTGGEVKVYNKAKGQLGEGIYFTTSPERAGSFGPDVQKFFLKMPGWQGKASEAKNSPFDDADDFIGGRALDWGGKEGIEFMVDSPNQIKSADPVVRDDAGEIIPPSQRFNSGSRDIRYSLAAEAEPITDKTRSRFASPDEEAQEYEVLTQDENDKRRDAWIKPLGTLTAADMVLADKLPKAMEPSVKVNIVGTLLTDMAGMIADPNLSEDERLVVTAKSQQLGDYWQGAMSQQAGRALQQRAVQNARLFPFAPILAANGILVDRAEKIIGARFNGGSEAAAERISDVDVRAAADADERVERILHNLIGTLQPKQTARGALAAMFRGKGQRDQIIDEVGQALMTASRGRLVTPERRTAIAQLVSSLKGTLAAQVKGEARAAPASTLPELLTRAFVNQQAEADLFKQSWEEGRKRVLDMLIGLEMDKTYYPLEKQRNDLEARLAYLDAGSDAQREDSAVERQQLKDQINAVTDSMKAEKKAIAEMVDDVLTPQRDALMPASVPMAFDPAASKEAVARAFEAAGYTAELATGLDKSGKRALSMKDAVRDKKRAVEAVMKVFDAEMQAQPSEWTAARATARQAVVDTLDQWQKDLDAAAAARQDLVKEKLLDENSKALEQLVNQVRAKIAPDTRWRDIFYDLPSVQDKRAQQLWDRINKHEALQNLTPDERQQLADGINQVWQNQRQKLFKKELKKAGVLGEKSLLDRAKVFDAAPRLMRLLNLGVFNASGFRDAVAKEYGLRLLTSQQAQDLRQMAAAAWQEPEGVLRNRKLREMLEKLQSVTTASWSEIINSYWTASVLSGLRTQFDTYMAVLNGFGTNLLQAGTLLARGKGQAAIDAHLQWWKGLLQGSKEALLILAKGDTSFLKRFSDDVNKAMEGEHGFSPVPTGERLWKEGNWFQKFGLAPVMLFTGRLMTAADHINNTATTQGAMAVARALHPDIYGDKAAFTAQETADARKQAIREALGGKDPATYSERRLVDARTREILNGRLSEEDRAAASEVGDIAAFQNDPTGFFGTIYSAVKGGLGSMARKLDEVAQDEEASKITRAITATLSGTLHAITGTRFMRFGFNFGNDIIRYIPGSYLAGKAGFFGRETSPMQRDLLLGKNVVGLILGSTLAALFGDDDEEKDDEWHIEGDWTSWSREDQARRRSAGLEPGTLWKRSKDGTMTRVRYMQWPTMGLFAAVGGMQDERRAKPEVWAERGAAGHLLNAAAIGAFQVQNVSAMRGLAELFGSSSMSGSSAEAWKDKVVSLGTNYVGGLAPTLLKDVEVWHDPQNYKADGVMEQLMRGMPMARRFVNDGRPQLNLLGDPVHLNRAPWSRTGSQVELDPAYVTLGKLLARGHDLQQPTTSRLVWKDGKKVPLETLGRDVAYEYEKEVTTGYKEWLTKDGDTLLEMPRQQADKVIDRRSKNIRDVALKRIQAKVSP
jgi:hypothetical protein